MQETEGWGAVGQEECNCRPCARSRRFVCQWWFQLGRGSASELGLDLGPAAGDGAASLETVSTPGGRFVCCERGSEKCLARRCVVRIMNVRYERYVFRTWDITSTSRD
jgi:hypothetical protein